MNDTTQQQQSSNPLVGVAVVLFAMGLGYMIGFGNGRGSCKRRRVFA